MQSSATKRRPLRYVLLRLGRPSLQPIRILLFLLAAAFTAEFGVMLLLSVLPLASDNWVRESLVDASLLTATLAPAFWLVIVRPLQRLSALRGQLLGRLMTAQEAERGRLARDLHDELGQQLSALLMMLRAVEAAPTIDDARTRARAAADTAAAGLAEVRRISRGLRPTVLDDLGLTPAVERLCRETQQLHNIDIPLVIDLPPDLRFAPAIEMCLFRVLQESLTNAARHARPRSISVSLRGNQSALELHITDDGSGFDPARGAGASFGLDGMRERVELLDGRFTVDSAPGRGTTIHAVLFPSPAEPHEPHPHPDHR